MSSSSTSDSQKQSSSLPIASSYNSDGVLPSSFNNWAEGDHNRETAFRPRFPSGPSESEDMSSWNTDAAVGSGINDYDENIVNSGSSGVLIDQKQYEGWNTNHALLSTAKPSTDSFNLFDVPFLDNNCCNDVVPPIQLFDSVNNGVYFGNQYVPNFDLGIANVEENDTYIDELTIDDDFIWKAGFCQRLNDQKSISTTGYAAEAGIPNFWLPSTSEASYVDGRQRRQWPLGQMGGRFPKNIQPSTTLPPENTPSGLHSHLTIGNDENVNASPSSRRKGYSKKPLPSKKLYTLDNDKYICRYKGPAKPEGCSIKTANMRYLCRHLRTHALKEWDMDITQEERVACNGMPEELLYIEVYCPFKKVADQSRCRFFRETGTMWKVKTLDRWENVMAYHKAKYHDTGDGS
ncbi:hypothetical protein Clacol_000206 [Clathrus columnatus]|uniref:Uncharacterized protein n=1 Tax=Clathrus columnatus TaxID=1419009 RepID=A0AAV4ZYJ3_9AGAM|nr:hypothetical protein Clacol_000206 [Clathrus columnatus]